jgi:hypothetical protein
VRGCPAVLRSRRWTGRVGHGVDEIGDTRKRLMNFRLTKTAKVKQIKEDFLKGEAKRWWGMMC